MEVLIIGGSGAYDLSLESFGEVIDSINMETPFGSANTIHILKWDGYEFAFLSRHGDNRYSITAPFVNYRANIYAAKELGVERIISWTGPGGMNENYEIGDYVIPDDIIDFTKNRKKTFFENKGLGFIRQNPLFCPYLRGIIKESISSLNFPYHDGGVYICTEGPRLETKAEIRFFKNIGGDMVGMTLVPEVFLSKELEICYATICYITNYAEGIKELEYKKGVLFEGNLPDIYREKTENAVGSFPAIIKKILKRVINKTRDCLCKDSMLRYKLRGYIEDDWRKWFK
jgi:5'-methylthioadenosine phosphorylase